MYKKNFLPHLLLAVFGTETFCITYGLKSPLLVPVLTFVYFLSGITLSVLFLLFPSPVIPRWKSLGAARSARYKAGLALLLAAGIWLLCRDLFANVPVDLEHADMLPIIRTMDQRFISGHWSHVYDIIPEIWKGSQPIYLPATWLPFSVPLLLHLDMRWVTAACVMFIFGIHLVWYHKRELLISVLVPMIAAGLLWWLVTENETHGFLTVSEEGMVAVYYVLLVMALLTEQFWLAAVAISLCMLSRYALIGWVPAFGLYLLAFRKYKQVLWMTFCGVMLLAGLFILPFGLGPFLQLLQLPGHYIDFARRVWQDSPEVFSQSMGFAKFYGPGHITALHNSLVLLTFMVPVLFVAVCIYLSRKWKLRHIPLAALKLSVVIFFSFIDVPYLYLFYTSSFISLVAVSCFLFTAWPGQQEQPVAR
jgi:hypothetical protein